MSEAGGSAEDTVRPVVTASGSTGRRQGQGNRKPGAFRKPSTGINRTRFEGRCDALKGYVYDTTGSKQQQTELYIKTTEEIAGYVGKTYDNGRDIRRAVEKLSPPPFTPPSDPPTNATETEKEIWKEEIKVHVRRRRTLEDNIAKLFSLVLGQCSESLRQKIEAHPDHEEVEDRVDGIGLLRIIKSLAHDVRAEKSPVQSLHATIRSFFLMNQGNDSIVEYGDRFTAHRGVLEEMKAAVADEAMMEIVLKQQQIDASKATSDQKQAAIIEGREQLMAMAHFMGADKRRFGRLQEEVENDFLKGRDDFPKTVIASMNLLSNYKMDPRNMVQVHRPANDGVAFTNVGNENGQEQGTTLTNTGNRDKSHIKCFNCQEMGHYANQCTKTRETNQESATQLLMDALESDELDDDDDIGFAFQQDGTEIHKTYKHTLVDGPTINVTLNQPRGKVNPMWILLDSQSTCDVFSNKKLLKDIHKSTISLEIHCNAGKTTTNMRGTLPGYGEVWYHPTGIANILSLARVKNKYHLVERQTRYHHHHQVHLILGHP